MLPPPNRKNTLIRPETGRVNGPGQGRLGWHLAHVRRPPRHGTDHASPGARQALGQCRRPGPPGTLRFPPPAAGRSYGGGRMSAVADSRRAAARMAAGWRRYAMHYAGEAPREQTERAATAPFRRSNAARRALLAVQLHGKGGLDVSVQEPAAKHNPRRADPRKLSPTPGKGVGRTSRNQESWLYS
jgi:hypothetical protein